MGPCPRRKDTNGHKWIGAIPQCIEAYPIFVAKRYQGASPGKTGLQAAKGLGRSMQPSLQH